MSRLAPGTHATLTVALLLAFGSRAGAVLSEAITPPSVVRMSTLASDAGSPEMTVITEAGGSDRLEPFVPGRVVVKFRSDGPHAVIECAQATFEMRRALADATADHSESLDRLSREVGVRSVRALLPERFGLSTEAARRRANDVRERLAKARPARAGLARDERPLPELFNVYVLEFDRSTDPLHVSLLYAADAHVEYAHPDYVATVQATPDDPYFSSTGSWGQPYDDLWGLKRISCPGAWDLSKGDGVVVAVVDTGLDMAHPDIAGNVWTNAGEIPGNGVDDDDNGYVDDVHGWSFAYGTADATDLHGHGTHVSGTIAAGGDNGVGVIGVAPRARIMPVKALNDNGSAPFSTLAVALAYAAANEADVINNSWSCSAPCPSVPVVEDAVRLAHGLGAVVVFAAGNTSTDVIQVSPQNLPESIVVSATDRYDTLTYFSSFGEIDVAAPGGGTRSGPPATLPEKNILSLRASSCSSSICSPALIVGTRYLRQAGTSMAAPHVSGLAALVIARTPSLTNEQVRQVLRTSAADVRTPGFDGSSGYGRVNASAAVAHEPPLEALLLGPSARPIPVSDPVEVQGRVQGPGLASWRLEYGVGTFPSTWTTIASSANPVAGGKLADWSISARPDGEYTLRLKALGTSGASYEDRQRVLVDRVVISSPSPSGISPFRSGDTVTLRGTAALGGFQGYSLRLRRATGEEIEASGLTAANGGLLPVVDGVLGTWVVPNVQEHLSIEMTVASSVQTVTESVKVAADSTLHPGWPKPLGLIGTEAAHYTFGEHLDAADIDGDGRDDLLVAYGKEVRVFDHTGRLLPGWPQTVAGPGREDNITQSSIAAGDVNGDGTPEIVVATAYGLVY
ncbi:partial Thermophilic serine proteinase, partial [Planctomycetaceae bacterium]